MTPTLPALLCLGLSVGLRTQVQAGTPSKPTIWAEPGSVVPQGSPVTIWCQGSPNAKSFSLNKEGTSAPWNTQPLLEPWDKANFSILDIKEQQAGRYHCSYFIGFNWTAQRQTLPLGEAGPLGGPGRERDPAVSVGKQDRHLPSVPGGGSPSPPAPARPGPRRAVPGRVLLESCELGPRGHLQVLSRTQHRALPAVTAQRAPGAPGLRLHGAESHPDGPRGLSPAAPRGPALPGSARPQRSPRRGPELSTGGPGHCPERPSPRRERPARELREEPLQRMLGALSAETPGERRAAEREEAPASQGGWGLGLHSRGPLPPSRGGRPDSPLLHPQPEAHPNAGAGPHPAGPQALSALLDDMSLILQARRLCCAQ